MDKNAAKKRHDISVETGREPDPAYFLRLIKRGVRKGEAKVLAGYSKATKTTSILNTKVARLMQTTEEQRQALQTRPGHTLTDNAERLVEIADNPKTKAKDRIAAVSKHANILGHEAPQKQQIEQRSLSLIAEFTHHSSDVMHDVKHLLQAGSL